MPTDLSSLTSRQNGRKSRGPITPEGKARSSRNRYTHGVLSRTICIEGEDARRFAVLHNSLRRDLAPRNSVEEGLVEDLAICRWRQRRLLSMETACLTREIRRQGAAATTEPPAVRATLALAAEVVPLDLISRYEARIERQAGRILHRLATIRVPEQTNPGSN